MDLRVEPFGLQLQSVFSQLSSRDHLLTATTIFDRFFMHQVNQGLKVVLPKSS